MVYDFCETRAGEHCRSFLGQWQGALVCDDFSGYKAGFARGITEAGCLAHARRKFFDLHVSNKSQMAQQALDYIGQLYDVERQVKHLNADDRRQMRQTRSKPLADALHQWIGAATHEDHRRLGHGQGTGLQLETLGRADPVCGGWSIAD